MNHEIVTAEQFFALKEALEQRHRLSIKVVSGSMEPVLLTNQKYWVEKVDANFKPRKFDIIVYWDGTKLICHYYDHSENVMNSDQQVWILKPLTHDREDFPVSVERVLGLVDQKIPFFRKLTLRFHRRNPLLK